VAAVIPGDPRQPTAQPIAPDAPRAVLDPGATVGWTGTARSGATIVLGLVIAVMTAGLAILTQLWALLVIGLVVIAIVVAMSSAVVRVDEHGVAIHSPLGWPRLRVPLDEVVRADVTTVRPLPDFGGWGWRAGRAGRVGIVMRRGEALLVERTGGRAVVATVDGAAAAAGLVNALADRARSTL
jgi:hypothetical protein